jgi:hypothetical protein
MDQNVDLTVLGLRQAFSTFTYETTELSTMKTPEISFFNPKKPNLGPLTLAEIHPFYVLGVAL